MSILPTPLRSTLSAPEASAGSSPVTALGNGAAGRFAFPAGSTHKDHCTAPALLPMTPAIEAQLA